MIAAGSFWMSRYNTKVSQRAYLGYAITLLKTTNGLGTSGDRYPHVTTYWKVALQNSGTTPALDLNCHIESGGPTVSVIPVSYEDARIDVSPKAEYVYYAQQSEVAPKWLSSLPAKITLNITFKDVFGDYHEESGCFMLSALPSTDSGIPLIACGRHEVPKATPPQVVQIIDSDPTR
jgi:hypothetical protein